ncbi:MAG: class I SAM-dependent methyltransferase [Candidatus Dormibacterales bacterium]
MKSKELFPAVFGRHAQAYQRRLDELMTRGEARGRQRVLDLVQARPGDRVVDLACGPGTLTRRLAALVGPQGSVVGVDLSAGMIALARKTAPVNATFEVMDIESLSLPNGAFDGATCGHGLQFAPNLGKALGEARRVLRTGGRLAASVPLQGPRERAWEIVDQVIDRRLPPAPEAEDSGATREVVGDANRFKHAALDAGFSSAEVEIVEEKVRWESAEQLVALLTSWWDCAARMEGLAEEARGSIATEAVDALRREYPGPIGTVGRNHVLVATA